MRNRLPQRSVCRTMPGIISSVHLLHKCMPIRVHPRPLRPQVAMKLIERGFDFDAIAKVKREVQLQAKLAHVNIVELNQVCVCLVARGRGHDDIKSGGTTRELQPAASLLIGALHLFSTVLCAAAKLSYVALLAAGMVPRREPLLPASGHPFECTPLPRIACYQARSPCPTCRALPLNKFYTGYPHAPAPLHRAVF